MCFVFKLWTMREAFGEMDDLPLVEAMLDQPAILDVFSSINGELDLLEQLCSSATPLQGMPF